MYFNRSIDDIKRRREEETKKCIFFSFINLTIHLSKLPYMKMSSSSSQNEFSHRQGSIMSLPDEEDQTTIASDRFPTQQHRSDANDYSRASNLEDVQTASIDLQTVPDTSTDENPTSEEESREIVNNDQKYRSQSRSDSTDDLTTSFGFQQQTDSIVHISKEDNTSFDYESIIQSQKLYYDPHPELIRKPQMIAPLLYTQKVMVKFLKPPSIPLGPLIIREVRPPQPPPPPPLVNSNLRSLSIRFDFL